MKRYVRFLSCILILCLVSGCSVGNNGTGECVSETATDCPAAQEISSVPDISGKNPDRFREPERDPVPPEKPRTGDAPAVISGVEQDTADLLDETAEKYGCAGVQLAVIKDGAVRYHYEYGFADKARNSVLKQETKYRCASLSKPVVAMVAAATADATDFDIDTDISSFMGYTVRNPRYPDVPITPRMLMTHTSSVIDSASFLESRNSFSSVPLKQLLENGSSYSYSAPGEAYVYSNFGMAVLAAALELFAGEHFETLAQKYLFAGLDLECGFLAKDIGDPVLIGTLYYPDGSVGYSVSRQLDEHHSEAIGQTHHLYQGNLTISATDYAKLICVLLNDGKAGGRTIISVAGVKEMLKPQKVSAGHDCALCFDMLETVIPGKTLYCHTGSNFGMFCAFAFDKDTRNGAVVFTSGADAATDGSGLYNVCADMIKTCFDRILYN